MHLIARKKEGWQNLVPTLCKAYLVMAYIVWKMSSLYVSQERSPFTPPSAVTGGYILSIVVLSFVAGIQKGRRQNAAAMRTLLFIAIGVVFLSMSFQAGFVLNRIAFVADVLVNGLVLCYVLNARRSEKMRALTLWIWGSSISLVREPGLMICNYFLPPLGNNVSNIRRTDFWGLLYNFPITSFIEFYWLGYLLAGVLCIAGVVLTIQKLRAKEEFNPSPNTAMNVALGFLAAMILMAISFMRLGHAEFLPAVAINSAMLYACFVGYRQFKSNAFVFLGLAAILTMARSVGLVSTDWYHNSIHNGGIYTIEQWLLELLLLGSIMATIFWGAGIVSLVRSIRPARK
jgi:predicted tellurium resistance membrane protein TerC